MLFINQLENTCFLSDEVRWVLKGEKLASLLFLLSPFDYSYPIDTRWRINFVRHFYEYKKTKNCITKKRASGFRTCNVMILKPLN